MNRGTTMRPRFRALAAGQNGGESYRRGIDRAEARLWHDGEDAAVVVSGYLSPEGEPCARVEARRMGEVRVLWEGPLGLLWERAEPAPSNQSSELKLTDQFKWTLVGDCWVQMPCGAVPADVRQYHQLIIDLWGLDDSSRSSSSPSPGPLTLEVTERATGELSCLNPSHLYPITAYRGSSWEDLIAKIRADGHGVGMPATAAKGGR